MSASITTIRRNTKKFAAVIETAHTARCYSLSNGFSGEGINPLWLVREIHCETKPKLVHTGGNNYKLRMHSNLWYEFEANA